MYNTKAYSAASATSPLAGTGIARRDLTEHDVQIEILFCGICHSDLHSVRNEWSEFMPTVYPIVPGHEIVGRVTKVGSAVTRYKPGDLAAVGCLVDSDGTCPQCKAGLEQFCPSLTLTFNSPDQHLGGVTYPAMPARCGSTLRANIDGTVLLVETTEQGENRNQCEEQQNLFGFFYRLARCGM